MRVPSARACKPCSRRASSQPAAHGVPEAPRAWPTAGRALRSRRGVLPVLVATARVSTKPV
eukprot:9345059-Lingulodinium_polyedra.AAC.1